MKYAFIEKHRRIWPAACLCRKLGAARSGYYAWRQRASSRRQCWREQLVTRIRRIHLESRQTYGSPRVHRELAAQGIGCCVNTVAKVMKAHGIGGRTRRRFRVGTTDSRHEHPVAANLLDRRFHWPAPDRAWAGDITYVPTGEGWLYLAVVVDLCSRRVIGWAFGVTLEATLAIEALTMALQQRRPVAGLLMHSDRGVQYACRAYRELLERHQVTCSMSRRGNCFDNAAMESFYKTLKVELVNDAHYPNRSEAISSIFQYIEGFYNRQRRHSTLGYQSPEAFEAGLAAHE